METGSKKHLIAEWYYETPLNEKLSRLLISDLGDLLVLSLYSELSKRLLAYKIMYSAGSSDEIWLQSEFAAQHRLDLRPEFELLPRQFAEEPHSGDDLLVAEPLPPPGCIHFSKGLLRYNAARPLPVRLCFLYQDEWLNVLVFKEGNCVFSNAFSCKNETEILYYLLSALQVSGLSPAQTVLSPMYPAAADAQLMQFLSPYFDSADALKTEGLDDDHGIPFLSEMLFPNYLMSLCE